jgi:hypothetical protein
MGQDEGAFNAGTHGSHGHGGAGNVDDIPVDPNGVFNCFSLVLVIEAFLSNFASP